MSPPFVLENGGSGEAVEDVESIDAAHCWGLDGEWGIGEGLSCATGLYTFHLSGFRVIHVPKIKIFMTA